MVLGLSRYRRIGQEYRVYGKLGDGAHSDVYRVKDRNGVHLAAKFVSRHNAHLLERETRAMKETDGSPEEGTPYWDYFGRHGSKYVLVMTLLGESLYTLKQQYGNVSLKSALMLGIQMTGRVRDLHERGYVHRNIKPQHFLIGRYSISRRSVYLIDYGMATKYVDRNGNHKSMVRGYLFPGSQYFAPRDAYNRRGYSRRSDLESVIYIIIYLIKGLPWGHLAPGDIYSIAQMKENIAVEELCCDLPEEIKSYHDEVSNMEYMERPDYSRLRRYLRSALNRLRYGIDNHFEWSE